MKQVNPYAEAVQLLGYMGSEQITLSQELYSHVRDWMMNCQHETEEFWIHICALGAVYGAGQREGIRMERARKRGCSHE